MRGAEGMAGPQHGGQDGLGQADQEERRHQGDGRGDPTRSNGPPP